jgi:hypothetical protein
VRRQQRIHTGARQRSGRSREIDGLLEEAEPDARRNRRIVEPAFVHRDLRGIRSRSVLAEQLDDSLLVVAGRPQRVAERRGRALVCNRIEAFAAQVLSETRRAR